MITIMEMSFEEFIGADGKKYLVYPDNHISWLSVQTDLCRRRKVKLGAYKCITVWIRRNVEERNGDLYDYLYLEKQPGTEKYLAAVRR